jgi:ComF family protein
VCGRCLSAPHALSAEHFCAACGTPFLNASPLDSAGLCGLCRRGLTGFDAAFSFGEYDGELRRLIHLFKYEGVRDLAAPLARMLLRALPRPCAFDVIVPMPLHWWRRWQRGFNQADLLARRLERPLGVPLVRALRRARGTAPQAGLTRAQRRANVAGSFRIRDGAAVAGRHILLIDDVMTTGATLSAAAAVLKRARARRVTAVTVARADRTRVFFAGAPQRALESERMESAE